MTDERKLTHEKKSTKFRSRFYILALCSVLLVPGFSFAHSINGVYASLVSCDYSYSSVRGESGYTGTYKARGEYFTQYFGGNYCPA